MIRDIKIYTKRNCGYCVMAKKYLTDKGYDFQEIILGEDISVDNFKEIYPNVKSVPQIIIDNSLIGGYNDMTNFMKERENNNV